MRSAITKLGLRSSSVLFNIFVIAEPLIYFHVCQGIPLTKINKTRITYEKNLTTRYFLAILECSCCIQNLVIRQKEPVPEICFAHFLTLSIELHLIRFGLGASFTFQLHCSLPRCSLLLLFRFT